MSGSAARVVAMPGMPGVAGTGDGSTPTLAWLIGMWMVMMVAMMLPSAAPTILLFDGVARRRRLEGIPSAPVARVHARIPRGVDGLRGGCRHGAVGASPPRAALPIDGRVEPGVRRRPSSSRPGSISGCPQGLVPGALPVAVPRFHGRAGAKGRGARSSWACDTGPSASAAAGCSWRSCSSRA